MSSITEQNFKKSVYSLYLDAWIDAGAPNGCRGIVPDYIAHRGIACEQGWVRATHDQSGYVFHGETIYSMLMTPAEVGMTEEEAIKHRNFAHSAALCAGARVVDADDYDGLMEALQEKEEMETEKAEQAITVWVEQHRHLRNNGMPEDRFTWNFEEKRWKLFGELSILDKKTLHFGLKKTYLLAANNDPEEGIHYKSWQDNEEVIITLDDTYFYEASDYLYDATDSSDTPRTVENYPLEQLVGGC